MATEAAGQSLPDVIQMDYNYLGEYAGRHLIDPLDSYISSGKIDLSAVDNKAYLKGGIIGNKNYSIPLGINAPAVEYDPTIFQKADVPELQSGYSTDDLDNTLKALKAKVGTNGFSPEDTVPSDFQYYLRQRGSHEYSADGKGLGYTNDQLFVDYTNYRLTHYKNGLFADPKVVDSLKSNDANMMINTGKAAVHGFTSNLVVSHSKYAGHTLKLIAPPELPGGKEGNYLKPAVLISMSSTSQHKDAAAKFINFFLNDLKANDILKAERGVPISKKVRDHLLPTLSEPEKEQFSYIEYIAAHSKPIDPPAPKGASKVSDLFDRLQMQIAYGQLTPEDAAKQFREQANQILSNN
jgi:multiple sugar transport system substrate-binding protein